MIPYIGRYAPTPSGSLHLGNLRTALAAWCCARKNDGKFLLRFDDLDQQRVKEDKIKEHQRDLAKLGLNWDGEVFFQTQFLKEYQAAFEKLKESGAAYPCFCSRKKIREYWMNKCGEDSVIYPGTCRDLSIEEAQERIANNEQHCWRFRIPENSSVKNSGDFVLIRADGVIGYQLASAINDHQPGITHVIRGDDLEESSAFQKLIHEVLDLNSPEFTHVGTLTGERGRKLSKSEGDDDLSHFFDQGFSTHAIILYLAWTLRQITRDESPSLFELAKLFDLEKIPKGNFEMRLEDLTYWQARTS